MKFLQKVEPFILSKEKKIQQFALRILSDSFIATEESFLLALKANDEAVHPPLTNTILPYIKKYPISERGFHELMERINNTDKNIDDLIFFRKIINELNPFLIDKNKDQLIKIFKNDADEILNTYTEICTDDLETLIVKLEQVSKELEKEQYYNHNLFSFGEKIVKVIAEKHNFSKEEIKEIIEKETNNNVVAYKTIFMIMLAGHLKMNELIQSIIELLVTHLDDEVLVPTAIEALIKIRTDEVVENLKPYLLDDEVGPFAVDVLKNIKTPYAEGVLLTALKEVENRELKTLIADALCQQLSVDAIPLVDACIEEGYASWLLDLENSHYCNCAINNIDHPRFGEWKAKYEQEEMERFQQKRFDFLSPEKTPVKVETKIGRNDPCPCGSGKKHKKCCMNK